jgi:hypothetical protein
MALKGDRLLWAVVIVLIALWAFGSANDMGGLIHLLLVIAVIVILVRLVRGRKIL